jgi:TRAP-type transport system periplasmic protein
MTSKGAKVTSPSADPFRKAVQPVYGQARAKYGAADVDAFLADAEAVRKALPVK